MRQLILVSVFIVAAGLAACGKSPGERMAEAAIEARTGHKADVDADKGQMTIRTDQGEMKISSGGGTALPATFPKDVYLPRDYTVEAAMEMPNAVIVHLRTGGAAADVATAADRQMQADGWKSAMTLMQGTQGKVVMYEKGKRHAALTIADGEDAGVRVGYQLATEQQ
ncbi:hypothetical protein ACFPN1_13935 [Lysobacter yangpyeongensis]|uniref:Lipoprotein n=1 Tax=Lysobacter yangpyeongensis TaxID=346182 RepID=A0ABW0SQI8_9GAMM